MLEKLTEEELFLVENFYNPIAQAECLFSDYDNFALMEEEKLAHVRLGQIPLLSFEYLIDDDPNLTKRENFNLKKGAGDIWALGGRLFGKTLFTEKVDLYISMILLNNERVGFTSYDALHIEGILEEVFQGLEVHPFIKLFKPKTKRNPYELYLKNGYKLISINMNITGKKPGAQFFQKHFNRLYIEEASFETNQVYEQRRDSVSELGCVFRASGMTNFTKYSPCGVVFYDLYLKKFVINFPQYVNPNWGKKAKEQAIKDFAGEQSPGYRTFIKGEVAEDEISVFDMERVRLSYDENRFTKNFEISKNSFSDFQRIIIIEKAKNAEEVYLFADIGESAPTEMGIVFKINEQYRYVYNITLYNLTDKEQYKVFKWVAEKVKANYIALDCTEGTGRAIFRSLAEIFPKENMVWVSFNEKIPVDFEKDEKGNDIFKNGKPVYKEEYVVDWSIAHLKDLFYSMRMDMPLDYKIDSQLNSVRAKQSGTRITYHCVSKNDHTFQMFQVFSIAQWMCEFLLLTPAITKRFAKSGV